MDLPETLLLLAERAHRQGGRAWIVGGGVRDHLLGHPPKDLDVEVHGIEAAALEGLLRGLGRVKAVGRSFGVFKLRAGPHEYDVSLPQPGRAATPQGEPVVIAGDPHMGLEAALRRRDLTINAIAYDPLAGRYADPFGGQADLAAGSLRAVDPQTFGEDPLRVLRVVQFAARFGFAVDPALAALCRALPVADLPAERVAMELDKLLLRAARPSVGLAAGRALDVLPRLLPGLAATDGPELEAALDRAAGQRRGAPQPLALMWATLLHRCAIEQAAAVLDRLRIFTAEGYPLRQRVLHAVGAWPGLLEGEVSDTALWWMAEAGEVDLVGRVALAATGDPRAEAVRRRAGGLGVATRPLPPLLQGRDLQDMAIPPGPWMGRILRGVRAAQLDGRLAGRQDALALASQLWAQEQPRDEEEETH